jgi:hypothetical protein
LERWTVKEANADAPAPKRERTTGEVTAIAVIGGTLGLVISAAAFDNYPLGMFVFLGFAVWGKVAYDHARFVELTERFGHDAAVGIVKKTFWQGMTYEMLTESIG